MTGLILILELLIFATFIFILLFVGHVLRNKFNLKDPLTSLLLSCLLLSLSEVALAVATYRQVPTKVFLWYFFIYDLFLMLTNVCVLRLTCENVFPDLSRKKWFHASLGALLLVQTAVCSFQFLPEDLSKWFLWIGEDYSINFGPCYVLCSAFFVLTGIVISVVSAWGLYRYRKSEYALKERSRTVFIFVLLYHATNLLQFLLPVLEGYEQASIPMVMSMAYLTTRLNTIQLMEEHLKEELVRSDMNTAAKIQLSALPKVFPPFPRHREIDAFGLMKPAREVGGDFFDCFELDQDRVCFLIADVSGKGVPASLFMMAAHTAIRDCARTFASTSEIFTEVNSRLVAGNEARMFVTAWIGILDTATGVLSYTNAGHCYPFIARKGEEFEELKEKHGLFLAGMPGVRYRQGEIQLAAGDRIFLYTDGLSEATNAEGKMFTTDNIRRVLNEKSNDTKEQGSQSLLGGVMEGLDKFVREAPQFDDITMFALRMPPHN